MTVFVPNYRGGVFLTRPAVAQNYVFLHQIIPCIKRETRPELHLELIAHYSQ